MKKMIFGMIAMITLFASYTLNAQSSMVGKQTTLPEGIVATVIESRDDRVSFSFSEPIMDNPEDSIYLICDFQWCDLKPESKEFVEKQFSNKSFVGFMMAVTYQKMTVTFKGITVTDEALIKMMEGMSQEGIPGQ